MSKETQKWLDEMIKVGFTADEHGRGDAWHRRQGNDNSYAHAIPFKDAYELIASWHPVKVQPYYRSIDADDDTMVKLVGFNGDAPVAVVHSGNGAYLGTFTDRYADHGYDERLFGGLEKILGDKLDGDSLQIGSCGLLDGYRKAWVQLEMPDSIEVAGERFRPFITAASSLDGTLSTTYLTGASRVVCDNTLEMALKGSDTSFKVKNTTNSGLKIANARDALAIVFKIEEELTKVVEEQLSIKITEAQWNKFVDLYIPVPTDKGIGQTKATNRQNALQDVYHTNPMVSPWAGTAWGVQQAVSTYAEWFASVKSITREERNQANFLTGKVGDRQTEVSDLLARV